MTWNLGIDIGGTNFAFGVVDEKGRVLHFREHPVGKFKEVKGACKVILKCSNELINKMGKRPKSIGIGIPGLVDYTHQKAVNLPHFPKWKNIPVGDIFSKAFGRKVLIDNDANLASLAEMKFGKGKKFNDFVFMTLGTGIGGGLVIDRKIYRGTTGFAGEIGHIIINASDTRKCPCGARGCFEMFASGKAVPYIAKFLPKNKQDLIKKALGGKSLTSKLAYELALSGNQTAKVLWDEYGYWLGIGIAGLANTLGITSYILGGNVSNAFDFFKKSTIRTAKQFSHVLRYSKISLIKSNLGPMAGIIGASQLK